MESRHYPTGTYPAYDPTARAGDPHWYMDAIIYQVHVKAFFDSNADGIGDFRGLTEKLDYIRDLGVNTIWVMPFYPSPLLDDGYDVSNYEDVHPPYGTRDDVKRFQAIPGIGLKTAQRVVLELKEKLPFVETGLPDNGDLTARDALVELGWSLVEAERALAEVDPELSIEEQVRHVLRKQAA